MQQHHQQHNFWSGLSLGFLFGASALFLLGTKKGRMFAKQILEATEDLEGLSADVAEEVSEYIQDIRVAPEDALHENSPTKTIANVIDKIQSVFPEKKDEKNFFVKNGRELK